MTETSVKPMDENTRRYYLDVMGIQCWELIQDNAGSCSAEDSGVHAVQPADAAALLQLETEVQQCSKCQLHATRQQAVTGQGNLSPDLMFVLLSPDENAGSSVLFSAELNQLFIKMLAAINIAIDDVYVTSLLKCSVPAKHTVSTAELHFCSDYLKTQVHLLQPKLLVILGETAARCMLQHDSSLDELRTGVNSETYSNMNSKAAGISNQFESVPLFVSYSPQELVQQPGNKRKAWQDLQQIQKIMETF